MKRKKRTPEQDDLLRPRLVEIIDIRHKFVKLAALIRLARIWWRALSSTPELLARRRRSSGSRAMNAA
jgi:hypothetical protein